MSNWYAVQVTTGKEEETSLACRRLVSTESLKECFVLKSERMRRYEGAWHKEEQLLFPGYMFLITDQVEKLYYELKQVPELTKILGDGSCFIPLEDEEVSLMLQMGGKDHVVAMSFGYIVGEEMIITRGPLQNVKGIIRKIDRHKRTALIYTKILGHLQYVTMGLEIAEKIS